MIAEVHTPDPMPKPGRKAFLLLVVGLSCMLPISTQRRILVGCPMFVLCAGLCVCVPLVCWSS